MSLSWTSSHSKSSFSGAGLSNMSSLLRNRTLRAGRAEYGGWASNRPVSLKAEVRLGLNVPSLAGDCIINNRWRRMTCGFEVDTGGGVPRNSSSN